MKGFSEWVRQPMNSPDHPHGEKIMKSSQDEFKSSLQ